MATKTNFQLSMDNYGNLFIPNGDGICEGYRLAALWELLWGGGEEVQQQIVKHTSIDCPLYQEEPEIIIQYEAYREPDRYSRINFSYLDLKLCRRFSRLPEEIRQLQGAIFPVGPAQFILLPDYTELYVMLAKKDLGSRTETAGPRAHGLIRGQPGIGKSVSLMYFLIRRLLEKQPTIFSLRGMLYQFDADGVSITSANSLPPSLVSLQKEYFWVLVDEAPLRAFEGSRAFLLIAASPDVESQARMKKFPGIQRCYLDLWQWHELWAARHLGLTVKKESSEYAPSTPWTLLDSGNVTMGFQEDQDSEKTTAAEQTEHPTVPEKSASAKDAAAVLDPTTVANMPKRIIWLMWCAYVRLGGDARQLLQQLRFGTAEELDADEVMEIITGVEQNLKSASLQLAIDLPAQLCLDAIHEKHSHTIIVTRPGKTGLMNTFDRKRRPVSRTYQSGFGTLFLLELVYDDARRVNKARAYDILQHLNGEPSAGSFLGRLFENLLLERYQRGFGCQKLRSLDHPEGSVSQLVFPGLKPGHREFKDLKGLSAVARKAGTPQVEPTILNIILKPASKTFVSIDALFLAEEDTGAVSTWLLQSTVALTHGIKFAPKGLQQIIDTLPADAKRWDKGSRVYLVFCTTSENLAKYTEQFLTTDGNNMSKAAERKTEAITNPLPEWLQYYFHQGVVGYTFEELLEIESESGSVSGLLKRKDPTEDDPAPTVPKKRATRKKAITAKAGNSKAGTSKAATAKCKLSITPAPTRERSRRIQGNPASETS